MLAALAEASVDAGGTVASGLTGPPAHLHKQTKAKHQNIRVSAAASTPLGRTANSCSGA
jgi:hypothetical protein